MPPTPMFASALVQLPNNDIICLDDKGDGDHRIPMFVAPIVKKDQMVEQEDHKQTSPNGKRKSTASSRSTKKQKAELPPTLKDLLDFDKDIKQASSPGRKIKRWTREEDQVIVDHCLSKIDPTWIRRETGRADSSVRSRISHIFNVLMRSLHGDSLNDADCKDHLAADHSAKKDQDSDDDV